MEQIITALVIILLAMFTYAIGGVLYYLFKSLNRLYSTDELINDNNKFWQNIVNENHQEIKLLHEEIEKLKK